MKHSTLSSSPNSGNTIVLRCFLPKPTNNVELLEPPYGKWEVDAVSDDGETLYLVDGCGTIICSYMQVRLLSK